MDFEQMLAMQQILWEKHQDKWSPMEPVYARNSALWMIGEIGEVIDIIKKSGEDAIMTQEHVRAAFVEELVDVQMYFNDILLRYQITPEEFSAAYRAKHDKNMGRNFTEEIKDFTEKL